MGFGMDRSLSREFGCIRHSTRVNVTKQALKLSPAYHKRGWNLVCGVNKRDEDAVPLRDCQLISNGGNRAMWQGCMR